MPGRQYPLITTIKTKNGDYPMPSFVTQEIFDSIASFKPDEKDIFVATYPKNGTTWMLYLLHILRGGKTEFTENECIHHHYVAVDFIGAERSSQVPSPRLIKTHLKFEFVPFNNNTKYIFVARNPKDTVVSFFYHTVGFKFYDYADGKFSDYLDHFLNGSCDFGDYFEMVATWWQQSKKHDNIYFLLYEDLKTNFEEEMIKIAEFLGGDFKKKLFENDNQLMNTLKEESKIEKTRTATMTNSFPEIMKRPDDLPFIRKGIIGDWKNLMDESQRKRVDDKMREAGRKYPGFDQLWDSYNQYL